MTVTHSAGLNDFCDLDEKLIFEVRKEYPEYGPRLLARCCASPNRYPDHLRSNAGIAVDLERNEIDAVILAANELEPIQHGGGIFIRFRAGQKEVVSEIEDTGRRHYW